MLILSILAILAALLFWAYVSLTFNYAAQAMAPIEADLAQVGAVKKCSSGDAGRGPSNLEPRHTSRYEIAKDKVATEAAILKVAENNGFNLKHSDSPYESIEWYADRTTKDSPFSALKSGKVELVVSLYSNTKEKPLACFDGSYLPADATQTAFTITLGLPAYKN